MCDKCNNIDIEAKKKRKPAMHKKSEALQDETLEPLQELLSQGYTTVKWKSSGTGCMKCRRLNGRQWKLSQFVRGLKHSAPLFERGHVNDKCHLLVTGPGKKQVELDYTGII